MKKGTMLTALLLVVVMCCSAAGAWATEAPVVNDLVLTQEEQQCSEVTSLSAYELAVQQAKLTAAANLYADLTTNYADLDALYYAIYNACMGESKLAAFGCFSAEQVSGVIAKADELYAASTASDKDETLEMIHDMLQRAVGNVYSEVTVLAAMPTSGTLASGTYQLTTDVNLTAQLTTASNANVTIDLNGYTLKAKSGDFVVVISGGTTLTIIDSNPTRNNGSGTGYTGGMVTNGGGDRGGAFLLGTNSNLIMNGGTIYGCSNSSSGTTTDAVHKHTVTSGGAIYINEGASFTMNGGTIANCTSANKGGAVFIDGKATRAALSA